MAVIKTEVKLVQLRHPINDQTTMGQKVDWYHHNGRCVGMVLLFSDGHQASLTFSEIAELQEDKNENSEPR